MPKETLPSDKKPWYEGAFGPDYGLVYPHRDLDEARSDARFLADLGLRAPVLDLACGDGRHLVALAEAGVRAFGLDLSPDRLAAAPAGPVLLRADHRRLPLGDACLGSALSLFSSFGYSAGRAEDLALLREVARVLAPGGSLVLDQPNPGPLRRGLVPESRTRRGELLVIERRALVDGGRRVEKRVEVRGPGGSRTWREDLALYEARQLEELLGEAGLEPDGAWGGLDGRPVGPDAPRVVLRASRPAG